jgi:hypothetical protein
MEESEETQNKSLTPKANNPHAEMLHKIWLSGISKPSLEVMNNINKRVENPPEPPQDVDYIEIEKPQLPENTQKN